MSDDQTQAERDAQLALSYAVKSVNREDAEKRDRTMADAVEFYAMEFLDHLDGSVPRALQAARTACLSAASEVSHPRRWRVSMRAVELARRAAGLTGQAEDDEAGGAGRTGGKDAAATGRAEPEQQPG
jgi:hypothetical protein